MEPGCQGDLRGKNAAVKLRATLLAGLQPQVLTLLVSETDKALDQLEQAGPCGGEPGMFPGERRRHPRPALTVG